MPSSGRSGHGFKHCICAPVRLLSRLRDVYVNNMNKFATQMSYDATFGCPSYGSSCRSYGLRSSKSCSSLDDELADLIRAAAEKNRRAGSGGTKNARSRSVAITRIDEDKPCDFKDCDINLGLGLNFARSQSSAHVGPVRSRSKFSSFD
ncbi:hypothetical protein LUZ62_025017 [Rhynchospora pubera]|uniref:Uncharacterized protein n=1 Tax=Rhynchospora pubera TaxID=906938 RepID=A0AAV8H8C8_9POAL|nr:hypothetical protein LUZ62_025017 [Rhynchospora pubera]